MGLEGKEDWKEGIESRTFSLHRGSKEWIMSRILYRAPYLAA